MKWNNIEKILLIVVFSFILLVGFKFCVDKSGYHVDEVYTSILSNSKYAPWIQDIKDGDITNKIITKQELVDFISVGENDKFEYGSVYYNQTKDVHPPLYYFIIHTLSSIFAYSYSKWIGLGVNIVLFSMTLALLYYTINKFWKNSQTALLITAIYGLSNIGLSTMLFVRMYMLLTFFTLLLAYIILEHLNTQKRILYPAIFITMFLGMLTQYYFVIYAFFLCASYVLFLLGKRKYRVFLEFSCTALAGVFAMLLYFPHFLSQLTVQNNVSIDKTLRNAQSAGNYLPRIFTMSKEVANDIKIAIFILLVLGIIILIKCAKHPSMIKNMMMDEKMLVIIPAYVAYIVVCIIAPYVTGRYVYHLIPVMLLLLSVLGNIDTIHNLKKNLSNGIVIFIVLASIVFLKKNQPDYLYEYQVDVNSIIEKNSDFPCVFVTENEFAPITSAIPQLLYFEECLTVNEDGLQKMGGYIANHENNDKVIVFLSTVFIDMDIDRIGDELAQSGYVTNEAIYENEFFRIYIFGS